MEKENSTSKLCREDSTYSGLTVSTAESGRPRQTKSKFSTAVYAVLIVQTIVVLCVYPIVIGIVIVSFQGEISKLELSIDHIRTRQQDMTPELTSSQSQGQRSEQVCNCPVQSYLGNGEDSSGLLNCCVADTETVYKLIRDAVETEHSKNKDRKRDRASLSIGQVERMVQSLVKRNESHVQIRSQSLGAALIPVATHVTAPPLGFHNMKPIREDRGKFKVGPWECDNGQSFSLHVNIDSHGHHMIVPKSGVYHIYSQAYFRDERDENERRSLQVNEYLHFTVLDSSMYSVHHTDLMKSGRSQKVQGASGYYYSSYHSGLFKLRENDKIYMKVYLPSEKVKLDSHQESTFMGMYLVSDDNE